LNCEPLGFSEGQDSIGNWCGAEVQTFDPGGFQYVAGEFTVPNVQPLLSHFNT
jgi:hypothetical protein